LNAPLRLNLWASSIGAITLRTDESSGTIPIEESAKQTVLFFIECWVIFAQVFAAVTWRHIDMLDRLRPVELRYEHNHDKTSHKELIDSICIHLLNLN